ncbi:MAG: MFS transporter [Rikenellaceae bacterium]
MAAKLTEKIGYGFGDLSSSMFWKIFTYYLPFFYSNVFGLRLQDATLLVLITKLWDAVSDPMMGVLADRTSTKWGKYRPYLLWIAAPFAIAGILTFTTPNCEYGGKLVWAYATYILMMTVYTAINVPYGAMLGVMSADSKERTTFSSYRMFFAYGGSFVALAIFEPLRDMFGRSMGVANPAIDPTSWQLSMGVVALLCLVIFVLCFLMTKERIKPNENQEAETGSISKDLKSLVGNAPWWILLGVSIAVLLFNSIRGGAAAYYFADYIGTDSFLGNLFGSNIILSCALFLAVGEIANMLGVVLAVPLSNKIGKKWAYMVSIFVAGALSVPFYFLTDGSTGGYWTMLILQIIISVAAGVTLPLVWSMFADVADYSEHKNGRSSVGLIFSSSSMAQKFGGAFGTSFVLWLLTVYNYQTPVDGVSVAQSEVALEGLRSLMSWIPALASVLGVVIMLLYPLSEQKMDSIREELAKKRIADNE